MSTGQGILGNNMFAYCGNNPIVRVDENGQYYTSGQIHDFVIADICKKDSTKKGLAKKTKSYIQNASSFLHTDIVICKIAQLVKFGSLNVLVMRPLANLPMLMLNYLIMLMGI